MGQQKRKQLLPTQILEQFDSSIDFNERSVETLRVLFKFLSSVDLREHSAKSLANLGKSLITNVRKARKVLVSKDASEATISDTVKLIDDMFELLKDILLSIEDAHDLGLTEPADRQLVLSFMGEYLRVCNEEETHRLEVSEEPEDSEELVLDGINLENMLDTFILE